MDILVLSVSVFRLFRKPVAEVEHDVCGDTVVPRLGDALGIDFAAGVGELLQQVVAGDAERPRTGTGAGHLMLETFLHLVAEIAAAAEVEVPVQRGVPDEFRIVHRAVVVPAALADAEDGAEVQVVREFQAEVGAVLQVPRVAAPVALALGVGHLP